MNATEMTILWLVIWWAILLFQVPAIRFSRIRAGVTIFDTDGKDIPGYGNRLTRALGNCQENIPLFIGLMLFALFTGNADITNSTAYFLLAARVAQSVCHLISYSRLFSLLRFLFFVLQWLLVLCWVVQLLLRA